LAFDFGKAVNSGGYLTALRRTKIGEFDVINAENFALEKSYFEEENTTEEV